MWTSCLYVIHVEGRGWHLFYWKRQNPYHKKGSWQVLERMTIENVTVQQLYTKQGFVLSDTKFGQCLTKNFDLVQ